MTKQLDGATFHKMVATIDFVKLGRTLYGEEVYVGGFDGALILRRHGISEFVEVGYKCDVGSFDFLPVSFKRLKQFAAGSKQAEKITFSVEKQPNRRMTTEVPVLAISDGTFVSKISSTSEYGEGVGPKFKGNGDFIFLHGGALNDVLPFASKDDSRPILTNVSYRNGTYCTTDSYRLAIIDTPTKNDVDIMIPQDAARLIAKLSRGDVEVELFEAYHKARVELVSPEGIGVEIIFNTGHDKTSFPNYGAIIFDEKASSQKLSLGDGFVGSVMRLSRLAKGLGSWYGTPAVVSYHDDDSIKVVVKHDNDTVEFVAPGSIDKATEIAFNPNYFAELFKGTNVDSLFGKSELSPWGIEEEAPEIMEGAVRRRFLMPVRFRD